MPLHAHGRGNLGGGLELEIMALTVKKLRLKSVYPRFRAMASTVVESSPPLDSTIALLVRIMVYFPFITYT
jgi:hypothetical protein